MNLYSSLQANCDDFRLFIYAFDDFVASYFEELNLPEVVVITLDEFENEELLSIKPQRTVAEYCWTCTPSIILHAIEAYSLDYCTYVDSDVCFYSDPQILLDELGEKSVLITPHNYTPKYDQSETSGIFCVQFMTFKNSDGGMKVLKWWVDACIEWCFARHEDGKFGDQKYLDDWPERFKEDVHVCTNIGAGVAPWNVQQFQFINDGSNFTRDFFYKKKKFKVVFYHYHGLRLYPRQVDLGDYHLSASVVKGFYTPYLREIYDLNKKINFSNYAQLPEKSLKTLYTYLKRKLKSNYNFYHRDIING